jgi:hypothetical protein
MEKKERDIQDRHERYDLRTDRFRQLHGVLDHRDFPWKDAANFDVPIMMIAGLRTAASLENATKSMRPLMNAKAVSKVDKDKEERTNQLLDYQFFVENRGQNLLDDFTYNFVHDEAAFIFTPWVRETQTVHEIRVQPPLMPDEDHIAPLMMRLPAMFDQDPAAVQVVMKDDEGWDYEVEYTDKNNESAVARVEFYERDDDGKIEALIIKKIQTHDGPAPMVEDFEDILFPIRSANLQPPSLANPRGADYVIRLCNTPLDAIERGFKSGLYDLLTEDDMEKIRLGRSDIGSGSEIDQQKEQKDGPEKNSGIYAREFPDRQTLEYYGMWDVDGDGLEENVIFWVIDVGGGNGGVLAKACLLSEMYPGVPLKRPIANASFIPIPNRVYGKSLDELLLSCQLATQTVFNQHIDWGTITNTPMFFYRASSGLKPEPIYIEPGTGYPLDNPQQDVNFPTWPTKDSSYTVNTITLLQQFAERIQMFSDVSLGRVPTGKASALRTMGTTMSLLQQADVRGEQVLRRFFVCLADTYDTMHRLNRRFLPTKKEYRVVGIPQAEEYQVIESAKEEVDFDTSFEFKGTLLNTNKQIVQQGLQQAVALLVSPLAMQAGIVTPEEVYNLFSDVLKASDLSVDRYMKKPFMLTGPRISAEEVLAIVIKGGTPVGSPLEPPEIHMQMLMKYLEDPEAQALMTPREQMIIQQWMQNVQMILVQQQMMMQSAGKMTGGPEGEGGEQTTAQNNATQSNPQVNSGELLDESVGPAPGMPQ